MPRYTVEENEEYTKWYKEGTEILHRTDGPAIELANGTKHWYQNNQRHRTDGPAIEWENGDRLWYQNNQRHRLDGPAVEWKNGDRLWYQNNQRHRTDGPAVEYADGDKEYWINGRQVTFEDFEARNCKELSVAEVEKLLGYKVKIVDK